MSDTSTDSLDSAFAHLRRLGVHRSHDNRVVAGVARGVAERYDIDPVLVRVALVLLGMFFGFGLTLYLIAWLLLPTHDGSVALERAIRDRDGGAILLCIVTAISVVSPPSTGEGGWIHTIASALALGGVVWFIARNVARGADRTAPGGTPDTVEPGGSAVSGGSAAPASTGPAPAATNAGTGTDTSMTAMPTISAPSYGSPTRGGASLAFDPASGRWVESPAGPPAGSAAVLGAATAPVARQRPRRMRRRPAGVLVNLIAIGLVIAAAAGGYLLAHPVRPGSSPTAVSAAAGLAAMSLLLLVLGFFGRRAILPALLAVLLAVPAVSDSLFLGSHRGVGEKHWAPTTAAQLQSDYALGMGAARLDLSGVPAEALAGRSLDVHLGVGEMTVTLPPGVTADVEAHVGVGSLNRPDGRGAVVTSEAPTHATEAVGSGPARLAITAHVGAGDLTFEQRSAS